MVASAVSAVMAEPPAAAPAAAAAAPPADPHLTFFDLRASLAYSTAGCEVGPEADALRAHLIGDNHIRGYTWFSPVAREKQVQPLERPTIAHFIGGRRLVLDAARAGRRSLAALGALLTA
jgi:hypothetical protein